MKLRSFVFLGSVAVALAACGDDGDSGGGGSGGSGTGGSGTGGSSTGGSSSGGAAGSGTGGAAGSATGGAAGSATGGAAGSGTGGSGTGGSGTGGSGTGGSGTGGSGTGGAGVGGAGTGGSSGALTAEQFCATYETHCGYGTTGHYASADDCKTKYTAYSETRKACVVTHVGLATSKTSEHCTHAAGAPPCGP